MKDTAKLSLATLAALLIPLTACSIEPARAPADTAVVKSEPRHDSAVEAAAKHRLTRELFAKVLTAELALQRDNPGRAWREYYEAAKKSGYAELAQRAYETAESAQDEENAAKSAALWDKLDPRNERVVLAEMTELLAAGRFDEAVALIAPLLKEADNPNELLGVIADMRSGVREKTRFYTAFNTLAAPYADNAPVQLLLGAAAAEAKMREEARNHGVRAIELMPNNPHVLLQGADFEYALDPKAASARLAAYLKDHPGSVEVRLSYAKTLLKTGDRKTLNQELAKLEKTQRDNPRVTFILGMFAEEAGMLEKAERFYRRYLLLAAEAPGSGYSPDAAYVRLGMVKLTQGHKELAVEWLHKVEKGDKYQAARLKEVELLAQMRRTDEACSVLKSIRADSDLQKSELVLSCAQLLTRDGRREEALAEYSAAVKLAPDNAELLYEAAMRAVEIERVDVAEPLLERFIELLPDNPNGYNALGYLWLTRNTNMHRAAAYIEKAMELSHGKDPYIVDSLGWLRYRQGRIEEAETHLRAAQNANPSDVEIALHLAEVLFELGKKREAEGFIRSVLEGEPHNEKARALKSRYGMRD